MAVALRPALPSLIAHTWPAPPPQSQISSHTHSTGPPASPFAADSIHPPRGDDARPDPDLIVPPADVAPPSANRQLPPTAANRPRRSPGRDHPSSAAPPPEAPVDPVGLHLFTGQACSLVGAILDVHHLLLLPFQPLPSPAGILSHPHPSSLPHAARCSPTLRFPTRIQPPPTGCHGLLTPSDARTLAVPPPTHPVFSISANVASFPPSCRSGSNKPSPISLLPSDRSPHLTRPSLRQPPSPVPPPSPSVLPSRRFPPPRYFLASAAPQAPPTIRPAIPQRSGVDFAVVLPSQHLSPPIVDIQLRRLSFDSCLYSVLRSRHLPVQKCLPHLSFPNSRPRVSLSTILAPPAPRPIFPAVSSLPFPLLVLLVL